MEKQRVNDAVVHLGNLIPRARVFVFRKLSRKKQAFKRKEGRKSEKRIERLLKEVTFLKTLSKSGVRKVIARRMLLNTEDLAAKIESESISPEERAFYRLCKTPFIKDFIAKFRAENIDWEYWVPPLLAMWDRKVELKKTRGSKADSDEKNPSSIRDVSGTRKRRAGSDDSEGSEPSDDRAKRRKREHQDTNKKTSGKPEKRNKLISKGSDSDSPESREDDDEEHCSAGDKSVNFARTASKTTKPARRAAENRSGDGIRRQPKKKSLPAGTKEVESPSTVDSDDASESSSSAEVCRVPFRPYAPKYFMQGSGTENSDDDDVDDDIDNVKDSGDQNHNEEEHAESSDEEDAVDGREIRENGDGGSDDQESSPNDGSSDDESGSKEGHDEENENKGSSDDESDEDSPEVEAPPRKTLGKSGLTVKLLEGRSKENENDTDSEDSSEDEEGSSVDSEDDAVSENEDEDSEGDSSDSDRERNFEARIEKKFKSNGANQPKKINVPVFEPDSSEEEFPKPKTSNQMREYEKEGNDRDDDGDDLRAASFFLRKGEKPQEIPSRTVPKEQAPGLNRRQRRGHEKQRSFNEDANDDGEDAEPKSNFTFGRDFRSQKSSQQQDRPRKNSLYSNTPRAQKQQGPPTSRGIRGGQHQFEKNQRKPARFSHDGKFDPQKRRSFQEARRQTFQKEKEFDKKDRHVAERSDRPGSRFQPDQREQAARRDSASGAPWKGKPQDTPRPGVEEKLHPSWLAKKKLSASLNQPFQGKKIVFDD